MFLNAVVITATMYSWYMLFHEMKKQLQAFRNAKLFHNRHNCVVMYHKETVPTGWYPGRDVVLTGKQVDVEACLESILYFIKSAKRSLDIAMMTSSISCINNAIYEAGNRGVKIRMVVDQRSAERTMLQKFSKTGINLRYYVSPLGSVASILHYKYMVKDYLLGEGFTYTGSLNWSMQAIFTNYEDTVFTSNSKVVEEMHSNFEELWDCLNFSAKNNGHVQMVLKSLN